MKIENEEELLAFRYGVRLGALEERQHIIALLEGISPGSGIMGDDIGLAIELIKEEK